MRLYNTLTKTKEEFKPIDPEKVTMYVCGPTVYNYIHVGNARPLVVFDVLRRYLQYKGYEVDYLVNFTDIDDKMIQKANEEGTTVKKIADRFIKEYFIDAEGLLVKEDETSHPRAMDHIGDIISFIKGLEEQGHAYNVDGNVYFDISTAKNYGKLSKKKLEDLISGARVEVSHEKKNSGDFALWKKEKPGEPSWNSPWGKGRPGWHIECSVMAKKYLGETIDIHAGGDDLQFPHHENEIAQSESLTEKPFANYWLHNGMMNVDDIKMSKSKLNFSTVRGVSEEFDLEIIRFFILTAHYRKQMNFSRETVLQAKNGLDRLYNGKRNLQYLIERAEDKELNNLDKDILNEVNSYRKKFIDSMDDDINTADAISYLFEIVKYSNSHLTEKSPKKLVQEIYNTLMKSSSILGILSKEEDVIDDEIKELIKKREEARINKDYKLADELRDILKEKGIELEDSPQGTKWKRI